MCAYSGTIRAGRVGEVRSVKDVGANGIPEYIFRIRCSRRHSAVMVASAGADQLRQRPGQGFRTL